MASLLPPLFTIAKQNPSVRDGKNIVFRGSRGLGLVYLGEGMKGLGKRYVGKKKWEGREVLGNLGRWKMIKRG